MALKTMDPEMVRKLIEGVPDVITPAVEESRERFKRMRCPRCLQVGHCTKMLEAPKIILTPDGPEVVRSPYNQHDVLAAGYARCTNCETEFYPESNIIRHVEPFLTDAQPGDPPSD